MKQDARQAAFSHLLLSGTVVHEAVFEEMQETLGVFVRPNAVLVVSVDRYPDLALGKPLSWRIDIGRRVVESVQRALQEPFVWVWVAEGVLAVLIELRLEQPIATAYQQATDKIARRIQRYADQQAVSLSIGIGSYCDNPYLLQYAYEEAKESMIDRFFQGNRLIFHYERKNGTQPQWNDPLHPEERAELLARIRIGDRAGAVRLLKSILQKLANVYRRNVDMFKSEVIDLVTGISRGVIEAGADAAAILSENSRFIQDLYSTIRYDKFEQKVCDYVCRLAEQVEDANLSHVSPIIRQAIRYMQEHLQRAVSLCEVAQFCCVSAYHFSRLFKKEVGCSFVDYANRMRLRKALYYLEATDCTIQQVAHYAGFQDANYFSRIFKRYMHTTPTEYRKAKLC
ncbi:helix-turn-helix domain-containing protein [Effusibacillus pohliae]|uniref:helix-turn-helix domain-containing protein n=1 Tax=Effusibacillus pohliae TaxID=232270 RepID=UPI00036CE232|nr:helix-turn-helix domain-containing protein [Effusibacillus pohliae]